MTTGHRSLKKGESIMKDLLIGNAAVARGLYEAGCEVISSYPGTPSTEIFENLPKYKDALYCEWAPNEKVAMVFAAVNDGKVVFLVSLTDDLVQQGLHAGNMIKEIANAAGGGGGGKANMAQAGAKDASRIGEAFAAAEKILANQQ